MLHHSRTIPALLLLTLLLSGLAACTALSAGETPLPVEPTSGLKASGSASLDPPPDLDNPGPHVRFRRWSIEEGLSQTTVRAILQDSIGFLWVGTEDGLNKFDGHTFKIYRPQPGVPGTLSGSLITALFEDRDGHLWIGTYSNGLNRFDPRSEIFTSYRHDPQDPQSLGANQISSHAIAQNPDGSIWVGTWGGGLNQFDPATELWKRYTPDAEDPSSLSSIYVSSVVADASGTLWVGTDRGLDRFNPSTENFTHLQHDPQDPTSAPAGFVQVLLEDPARQLWIGTRDEGLSRLDLQSGQFLHFRHDPAEPHSLPSDNVLSLALDPWGTLWVGTDQGLAWLDEEKGRFIHYRHDPLDPYSLGDDEIRCLYSDRSGGLWVGTSFGALNQYDRRGELFGLIQHLPANPNSLSHNSIWSIYENESRVLWIGTNGGGLNRLDRDSGLWTHYRHDPDDPNSLANDVVVAIHEDADGHLWLGTWGGGLDRLNPRTGSFTHFRSDPEDPASLSSDVVWFLTEDSQGMLWVGTAGGLNRLDPESGMFTRYLHDPQDSRSLSTNLIGAIYEDSAGVLWVGTHAGLNRLDRQTGQFTHYRHDPEAANTLSNDLVFAIHEDRDGMLWLGTFGGGLNRFNPETEVFRAFRMEDGLPNDAVYGILEDDEGCLWLSTNAGLSRFDPRDGSFRNFGVEDGLQAREFNYNAYFQNQAGELYFGGVNGLNVFHPARISTNPYIPPVVLTSLSQGGESLVMDQALEYSDQVTLRWPNNYIDFEFSALNFFQPEQNQFAYRLDNFEQGWNETGARRFGRYTNLPGGRYTLQVIGSNNDGLWNEAGATLEIQVVPPFWQTWQFRGAALLVLAAAVIGGYRLRVRSIEARSRALEAQVADRTRELATLNQIATALSQTLDLAGTLNDALAGLVVGTAARAAAIFLRCPDRGRLELAAHRGLNPGTAAELEQYVAGSQADGSIFENGKSLVLAHRSEPLAAVPVSSRGEWLGSLFVLAGERSAFSEQDLDLLTNIGLQIGVAVENARLFQDTRDRLAQLDALQETTRAIVSTLDLDALLNLIVRQATELLKGGGGILNLVDWDKEEDEVVACVGSAAGTLGVRNSLNVGFSGWVSRHNQPALSNRLRQDPRLNPQVVTEHAEIPLRSVVIAPMTVKGQVIGTLAVIDKGAGEGDFNQSDLDTLVLFANQAATAIENARLYAGEQHRAEQFQAIAEVGRQLTLLQDMEAVLQRVARVIQQAFGYYHVGIGLVEGDEVVYRVGSGELWDDPGFQFKPARLKVGQEGMAGWVAATGEPLLIPDVRQDPRYVWMQGSATRSELTVPISVQGEVIGVLDAQSDQPDSFDETDLAVLESLANQAGTAIENARLYEQAQQLAIVEERQRLARDLHDSVTQALYGMTLYAEAMGRHLAAGRLDLTAEQLQELQDTAREALREMRLLIFQLRPLDLEAAGLVTVLRNRLEAVEERAGLKTQFSAPDDIRLPREVEEGLYRIAQEALNNTLKHANAGRISVSLRPEGAFVVLEICDDGVGFDPVSSLEGSGLGLDGMYERAGELGGQLIVESKPGAGARLRVEVPL